MSSKNDRINVSKVLIENESGKFLAVKEKNSGKWELPGGKIERDESRFEAAEREVKEETGLEISGTEEVVRVEVEGSERVNCWILYSPEKKGKLNLDTRELSDFRWVTPKEYLELNWHADAGYAIPALTYLEDYLSSE